MSATRRILVDCDPGVDDAIALMMALRARDRLDLAAVTTVAGNLGVDRTTRNALALLDLFDGGDIPVAPGCGRALLQPPGNAARVHGAGGLGGADLPGPRRSPASGHAVDAIIEACLAAPPRGLTLCPTGPMTNIALALVKEPQIEDRLERIVFMGGAVFCGGNVTPHAEFNIHADPHAAEIVLRSRVPKVMLGLDVTQKVAVEPAWVAGLAAADDPAAQLAAAMLSGYASASGALHDPCVIAFLLAPELFAGAEHRLSVDLGDEQLGRTAVTDGGAPVHVVIDADASGVRTLIGGLLAA